MPINTADWKREALAGKSKWESKVKDGTIASKYAEKLCKAVDLSPGDCAGVKAKWERKIDMAVTEDKFRKGVEGYSGDLKEAVKLGIRSSK